MGLLFGAPRDSVCEFSSTLAPLSPQLVRILDRLSIRSQSVRCDWLSTITRVDSVIKVIRNVGYDTDVYKEIAIYSHPQRLWRRFIDLVSIVSIAM